MDAEELAKRRAPDALCILLLAAYVHVNQPFLGGEDLETMDKIFGEVLTAVGDKMFSEAVGAQRPGSPKRSQGFLGPDKNPSWAKFPRAAALLRKETASIGSKCALKNSNLPAAEAQRKR